MPSPIFSIVRLLSSGVALHLGNVQWHPLLDINARFTPNSRGTWDWLTCTTKNGQTRGYSGVGRQEGRMFLLCYSSEGHKLLPDTRNNSGLLAIEIDKLHDRF